MTRELSNVVLYCTTPVELLVAQKVLQEKCYPFEVFEDLNAVKVYIGMTAQKWCELITEIEDRFNNYGKKRKFTADSDEFAQWYFGEERCTSERIIGILSRS